MIKEWKAYLLYGLVALLVMAPLLGRGYILTLDMVFTPRLPMPHEVTSSYLFHAGLHALTFVIPSDIIQKLLLVSIVLLASIGMHRLIRHAFAHQDLSVGVYIASIFFAINPYTYSRFMAGQYAVLLGYALLPWLVRSMMLFAAKPGFVPALRMGSIVTLIGIVSIHTLVAVAVLAGVGVVVYGVRHKKMRTEAMRYGLITIGMFVILSSYWLVPLILGRGQTATTIANFSTADTQAFMTTGSTVFSRIGHSLQLQGFWAERHSLYVLPQNRTVAWGLTSVIIFGLVLVGIRRAWNTQRSLTVWLCASSVVALVIASGLAAGVLAALPLGAGLREPHKLIMIVALTYGLFLAYGCGICLVWLRTRHEVWYGPAAGVLFALPFLYTRVMLWGFDGQLSPRQYPSDWFALRERLSQQTEDSGQVLFLPWHQYMSFGFAGR
ncbi:MAG TPA: hypothetical protein VLF43_00930, partial [Candidatus Saccharimonadales bacterium]|nr:hypothetical protein [Candidatus Saccharimonadales bacterium]